MKLCVFAFVGLLALCGPSMAIAQETPAPKAGSGPTTAESGGCGIIGYGGSVAANDALLDSRIASLKRELQITDGQEAVWKGYANALRATTQVMANMHQQMIGAFQQNDHSSMTVVDLNVDATGSKLPALEALKPATIALYKELSEEQKKKADERLPTMGCI